MILDFEQPWPSTALGHNNSLWSNSPRNAQFLGQARRASKSSFHSLFFSCPVPNSGNVRSNCEICGRMDEKQFWQFTFLFLSRLSLISPKQNEVQGCGKPCHFHHTSLFMFSWNTVWMVWSKDKHAWPMARPKGARKLCWMVVIYRNCSILPILSLSLFLSLFLSLGMWTTLYGSLGLSFSVLSTGL